MKSHKTSAITKKKKKQPNKNSPVPALDQKNRGEHGNKTKEAWSGLEPECT